MIEAMKQALEALKGNCTNPVADPEQAAAEDKAITALRQAIEQTENQEPVAWWTGEVYCDHDDFMYNQSKQEWIELGSTKHNRFPIPLYTAPQRKEWVNLTSQELATLTIENLGHPVNLTFAIEAKLKEKNT